MSRGADGARRGRPGRWWRGVGRRVRTPAFRSDLAGRGILALKSALAAGIAWFLAGLMPGVVAEYPWYAPVGAIVAMTPTVAQSLGAGLRTIAGVAVGAGVAFVGIWLSEPGVLTVPLIVGAAVLLGSFRVFGVGGSWVPLAALFVMLTSDGDPAGFTIGYLLQLLVGVVVGAVVNVAVFPPLYLAGASRQLREVKSLLADDLEAIGEELSHERAGDERWDDRRDSLHATIRVVDDSVRQARESTRANVRARGRRHDLEFSASRLRSLQQAALHTSELIDVLGRRSPVATALGGVAEPVRVDFADATRAVSAVVRVDAPNGSAESGAAMREADEQIARLGERIQRYSEGSALSVSLSTTALTALQGIVESQR